MILQDAIKKMKPGDKFLAVGNKMFIMNRNYMLCRCHDGIAAGGTGLTVALLDLEGQIIKPEPEVLTAEEIIEESRIKSQSTWIGVENRTLQAIALADKNGQIKEYKRLKPLIEAAKDYIENQYSSKLVRLEDIIEDIQPPWEIEE